MISSYLRPDVKSLVWMGLGFLVLPRLVRMVGR